MPSSGAGLILGTIWLEPTMPDAGRAYYMARTSIDTLALIEPPSGSEDGSNCLRWWRRRESNPRPKMLPQERLRAYLPVSGLASPGSGERDPFDASPVYLASSAGTFARSQPALVTLSSNHAGEVRENVTA